MRTNPSPTQKNSRSGITLLFVVSMIVLFLLMGTAFVVVANDFMRGSKSRMRTEEKEVGGEAVLDQAFFDFVRGPELTNSESPLRGIDLLSDMYGYGYTAEVAAATATTAAPSPVPNTNRQLIRLELTSIVDILEHEEWRKRYIEWENSDPGTRGPAPEEPFPKSGMVYDNGSSSFVTPPTSPPNHQLEYLRGLDVPGYFGGQVLTFVSDSTTSTNNVSAKGISARIVEYTVTIDTTPNPPVMRRTFVIAPEWIDQNSPFDTDAKIAQLASSKVVINGRPFSGFGAGTSTTFIANQNDAFRPNLSKYTPSSGTWTDSFFSNYSAIRNSVNEPYDAFDHDNIFLAQNLVTDATIPPKASFDPRQMLPNLYSNNSSQDQNRYSFRPIFSGANDLNNTANEDFPNAADTSGNPILLQNRALDVDNDFDGTLDSVWMDLGYPVRTTASGKRVKALVAPMILDMDSRLNVNVHGSIHDAQALATGNPANTYKTTFGLAGIDMVTPADPTILPRGMGLGTGDVSLAPLMNDYRRLLVGSPHGLDADQFDFTGTPITPGRYGFDRFPGAAGMDTNAAFRFQDYPGSAAGVVGGSFQSRPMDIHGHLATGFSAQMFQTFNVEDTATGTPNPNWRVPYGMPITDLNSPLWEGGTEVADSSYEMSILQGTQRGNDTPFVATELQAVIRPFDADSRLLPSRLLDLGVPTTNRNLLTTDSFEVPALPPALFGSASNTPQTVPERLYEVLRTNGVNDPNLIFAHMNGSVSVHSLLPPEVMRGLPMDINRRFGNGRDDNGNGVVDEHWLSNDPDLNESDAERYRVSSTGLDHNNDGVINAQDRLARQIFARHLFVLTWLTAGGGGATPQVPDMNNDGMSDAADIPLLAQWCINVVDYRDADAICTPFEYDTNPWDGWDVDGDLSPPFEANRGVVWGVERPELLITEVIATHERREEDRNSDGTFESNFVPKASVFVELFNPWATSVRTETPPSELYSGGGLNLAATNDVGDPVWRIVFTENQATDASNLGLADNRRVYFRRPTNSVEPDPAADFYHNGSTSAIEIAGNQYAVIGSSGVESGGNQFRTTFGRRTDVALPTMTTAPTDLNLGRTRSIILKPAANEVEVVDTVDGNTMQRDRRTCRAVPIGIKGLGGSQTTRSLGISDPTAGYVTTARPATAIDPDNDGNGEDGDGLEFVTPLAAQPIDQIVTHPNGIGTALGMNGVTTNVRYAQLQRLANPLAPYHVDLNPYITVDRAGVDLLSFNGVSSTSGPGIVDRNLALKTLERGEFGGVVSSTQKRLLWPTEEGARPRPPARTNTTDSHLLPTAFFESFGRMNDAYIGDRDPGNPGIEGPLQVDTSVAPDPFAWFAWNNRPYVSQYELLNVPGSTAIEALVQFPNIAPNFRGSNLKRVFGFLEVPPKQVGTEIDFSVTAFNGKVRTALDATAFNAPYNFISRYRYPGKINLNTITSEMVAIWNNGLMRNWNVPAGNLNQVRQDLDGSNNPQAPEDPIRYDGIAARDLPRAVADPNTYDDQTFGNGQQDGSLLRFDNAANLRRNSNSRFDNTTRNEAFANASLAKLGSVSTNRSSVFAIWITVGYFEVDEEGRVGAEVGSDSGEVKRHRGFYMFDRSIPVAFEPGKNHNIERAILVKTIIE